MEMGRGRISKTKVGFREITQFKGKREDFFGKMIRTSKMCEIIQNDPTCVTGILAGQVIKGKKNISIDTMAEKFPDRK